MKWEDMERELTDYDCAEIFMLRFRGCSWRRLAEIMNEKLNGDWESNQMAGIDLCEIAEKRLKLWFRDL